jgi:hypothetical protein
MQDIIYLYLMFIIGYNSHMSTRFPLRRLTALFGWTRHSYYLLSGFLLVCGLIIYIWWPLAKDVLAYIDWGGPWWLTFDWLLVGIWLAMSLLIMAKADLRSDARIVFVGFVGGLVIESWGTQTNLWFYYTAERPPLWIIPAWPIAALATDRLMRLLQYGVVKFAQEYTRKLGKWQFWNDKNASKSYLLKIPLLKLIYRLVFGVFSILMLIFVAPTLDKSLTVMAILLCALLILSPTDYRIATLTFLAGAGLGYFLEVWGTTRECWTYYTHQTPPLFAVLAHGMASVTFWRANRVLGQIYRKLKVSQGISET